MPVVPLLAFLAALQGTPPVDDVKIKKAVDLGMRFLKKAHAEGGARGREEEVLWTLLKVDSPVDDPVVRQLVGRALVAPLEKTTQVVFHALILENLDRVKHQARIAQCAQFLADNQCADGGWGEGRPVEPLEVPPAEPPKSDPSGIKKLGTLRLKPKVVRKIEIRQRSAGEGKGDVLISFQAAQGLWACHDSGVVFERVLIDRAAQGWREAQRADGGWGRGEKYDGPALGSITAAAVGSLCIYQYLSGGNWKKDGVMLKGVDWLGRHFTVTEDPGDKAKAKPSYLYLYALERAGMLYSTEKFGPHAWYPEVAGLLLALQREDGSWNGNVADTCSALRVLHRATRSLVEQPVNK